MSVGEETKITNGLVKVRRVLDVSRTSSDELLRVRPTFKVWHLYI